MRLYISGPIANQPDYRKNFNHAAVVLISLGHEIENPADIAGDVQLWPAEYFLRQALKLQLECDAIVLLDGWENSYGAWVERRLAEAVGMDVFRLSDGGLEPLGEVASIYGRLPHEISFFKGA